MDVQYETQIILEVPNVQIYEIRGKYQKLIQQGNLTILEIEKFNLSFIKLHGFQYTLQKQVPVMTQPVVNNHNLPLKMFIFPCVDHFYYGLIIDQTNKELCIEWKYFQAETFEYYVANKCTLVQPGDARFEFFQGKKGLETKATFSDVQAEYVNQQPQQQPQPVNSGQQQLSQHGVVLISPEDLDSQRAQQNQQYGSWNNVGQGQKKGVADYIVQGSELVKGGIIVGAQVLAKGIQQGGQFIQSKVTNKEEKQIDPSTINKVKLANTGVKAMYVYTRAQVEALVQMGKMVADEAGKQFEKSETGQKAKQNEHYEDVKVIGKAAAFAFCTVYDGLYQALATLGSTTADATTQIVDAKYGKQAGELSKEVQQFSEDQSFEVAGNVGQIANVYKVVAAKAVIQETQPGHK